MAHPGKVATDPVCGMTVSVDDAISLRYGDATYYFCERACAETFQQEPTRWVGDPESADDGVA